MPRAVWNGQVIAESDAHEVVEGNVGFLPLRAAAAAVALLTVAVGVAALLLIARADGAGALPPGRGASGLALLVVGNLGYAVLALFLAWKAAQPEAWGLGLALAAIGLNSCLSPVIRLAGLSELPASTILLAGTYALGAVAFIRVAHSFANPLTEDDCRAFFRSDWARRAFTFWVRPRRVWLVLGGALFAIVLVLDLASDRWLPGSLGSSLHRALNLAVIGFGALGAWINYRTSDAAGRRRIVWILQAAFLALAIAVLHASAEILGAAVGFELPASSQTWAGLLSRFGMIACFVLAIFWAGAIDPRLVLRKTVVYSASISILVFLFAVVENVVSGYLADRLGLRNDLVAAVAGAAVGLSFHPLREGLNRFMTACFGLASAGRPGSERRAAEGGRCHGTHVVSRREIPPAQGCR